MNVALWEWDSDAILVQGVVDYFFGFVDVWDLLRSQNVLFYGDVDRAITKVAHPYIDAVLRLHDVAAEGVFRTHDLHGVFKHFAHTLYIGAVSHSDNDFEELVGIAFGQVGEVFGEQVGVEERYGGVVDRIHLGGLVVDAGHPASDAVAFNPVANLQSARHELDAIDEVVDDVFEGETDTSGEATCDNAQRSGGDMQG